MIYYDTEFDIFIDEQDNAIIDLPKYIGQLIEYEGSTEIMQLDSKHKEFYKLNWYYGANIGLFVNEKNDMICDVEKSIKLLLTNDTIIKVCKLKPKCKKSLFAAKPKTNFSESKAIPTINDDHEFNSGEIETIKENRWLKGEILKQYPS